MSTLPNSPFKKAKREKAKLKITVTGPSGSGKTVGALLIAKGIGGKIALIDSENESASLYADQQGMPEFDTLNLTPPYTTQKYLDAINAAVKAGYDTVIIDSGTHQWAGEGGILARKEQLDQRPNSNSYTNWGKMTPEQEQFKNAILYTPINMIMTLRSKQDYAISRDEKTGKNKVEKLGMAPIQRDGLEYEFTTVFDVDMSHHASVSKDRTGIFDGKVFRISEETGKEMIKWLGTASERAGNPAPETGGGSSVAPASPPAPNKTNHISMGVKMPVTPKLSPDEFIVSGKLAGKKIDELGIAVLQDWAANANAHLLKSNIDIDNSTTDMARSYRSVIKQIDALQPSMFSSFQGGLHSAGIAGEAVENDVP